MTQKGRNIVTNLMSNNNQQNQQQGQQQNQSSTTFAVGIYQSDEHEEIKQTQTQK